MSPAGSIGALENLHNIWVLGRRGYRFPLSLLRVRLGFWGVVQPERSAPLKLTLDQRSHLTNRDTVLESKKHEGRDSGRYPEPCEARRRNCHRAASSKCGARSRLCLTTNVEAPSNCSHAVETRAAAVLKSSLA